MDDVLRQCALADLLYCEVAGFDVDGAAALFGDAGEFGAQLAFVAQHIHAARAQGRVGFDQAARVAGIINHHEFVGFACDGLEQIGHLAVGDRAFPAAVVGQQGFYAASGGIVFVARAVAAVMDEHFVAVLHAAVQIGQRFADGIARGGGVVQIGNIACGHLHGLRNLSGRFAVNLGPRQGRGVFVGIHAHANNQGVAVHTRCEAAHAQGERSIA